FAGFPERFNDGKQIIPTTSVQAGSVVTQLVQNLVHLECRWDRLDEHGRSHNTVLEAELGFGEGKNIIPQSRFEVGLHFRQVVERAITVGMQQRRVMEEV